MFDSVGVFFDSYFAIVDNSEEKALSWLIILCCGDIKDIMNKDFKGNSTFEILKYKLSHYSEYFKRIKISNLPKKIWCKII